MAGLSDLSARDRMPRPILNGLVDTKLIYRIPEPVDHSSILLPPSPSCLENAINCEIVANSPSHASPRFQWQKDLRENRHYESVVEVEVELERALAVMMTCVAEVQEQPSANVPARNPPGESKQSTTDCLLPTMSS